MGGVDKLKTRDQPSTIPRIMSQARLVDHPIQTALAPKAVPAQWVWPSLSDVQLRHGDELCSRPRKFDKTSGFSQYSTADA